MGGDSNIKLGATASAGAAPGGQVKVSGKIGLNDWLYVVFGAEIKGGTKQPTYTIRKSDPNNPGEFIETEVNGRDLRTSGTYSHNAVTFAGKDAFVGVRKKILGGMLEVNAGFVDFYRNVQTTSWDVLELKLAKPLTRENIIAFMDRAKNNAPGTGFGAWTQYSRSEGLIPVHGFFGITGGDKSGGLAGITVKDQATEVFLMGASKPLIAGLFLSVGGAIGLNTDYFKAGAHFSYARRDYGPHDPDKKVDQKENLLYLAGAIEILPKGNFSILGGGDASYIAKEGKPLLEQQQNFRGIVALKFKDLIEKGLTVFPYYAYLDVDVPAGTVFTDPDAPSVPDEPEVNNGNTPGTGRPMPLTLLQIVTDSISEESLRDWGYAWVLGVYGEYELGEDLKLGVNFDYGQLEDSRFVKEGPEIVFNARIALDKKWEF